MRKLFLMFIVIIAGVNSFLIHNCLCRRTAQTLPVNTDIIYCLKFTHQNTGWLFTGNFLTNYIHKIFKITKVGDNRDIIKESLKMILTKLQVGENLTLRLCVEISIQSV
jgi:hypothetical protein